MTTVHLLAVFCLISSILNLGLGLLADYKLCGDPECERMLMRVQAQRDHVSKDCLFLNFKKGEMITVYYKLTGKRNDLWAGSIDKLSGLFPKDAITIDQYFIDDKKEIRVPTQEFDFICFDENGLEIKRVTESNNLEDLAQEQETLETANNEAPKTARDSEENEPSQTYVQDVSDPNIPKTSEKGGSSWIGSAVNGWFGRNEQSNDEPQDWSSEESFKSRKIVMDIEDNQAEEESKTGTLGWFRGELTNAFGFGNTDIKADSQDNIEKPSNPIPAEESTILMSLDGDVLTFNTAETTESEKTESTDMEDLIIPNSQRMDLSDNNLPLNDKKENEDGLEVGIKSENEQAKEQKGWYNNIYNSITNLYGEEQTEPGENYSEDHLSSKESAVFASGIEDVETKESDPSSQSIFSVSGLTSVLTIPFQTDSEEKTIEEKTAKTEDPGKEEFTEEHSVEEEEAIPEIIEQDPIPMDGGDLSETQSLAERNGDISEDSSETESSLKLDENSEDRTDPQILESKFSDNLSKAEINPEVLMKVAEQGKVDEDDEIEGKNIIKEAEIYSTKENEKDSSPFCNEKDSIDHLVSSEKLEDEGSNIPEDEKDSQFLDPKNLIEVKSESNSEPSAILAEDDVTEEQNDEAEEKNIRKEMDRKQEILLEMNNHDSILEDTEEVGETEVLSEVSLDSIQDPSENKEQMNVAEESTNLEIVENKYLGHFSFVKSYFLEQLNEVKDKQADSDVTDSNDVDSISEAQRLTDEISSQESSLLIDKATANNSVDDINKSHLAELSEVKSTEDSNELQENNADLSKDQTKESKVINESDRLKINSKIVSYSNMDPHSVTEFSTAADLESADENNKEEKTNEVAKEDHDPKYNALALNRKDQLNIDENEKSVMERSVESEVSVKDEILEDRSHLEKDKMPTHGSVDLALDDNVFAVIDQNDVTVMGRNYESDVLSDKELGAITVHKEYLSNLEVGEMEIGKEHVLDNDINRLTEAAASIHNLEKENIVIHENLTSAPSSTDNMMDRTNTSCTKSVETEKTKSESGCEVGDRRSSKSLESADSYLEMNHETPIKTQEAFTNYENDGFRSSEDDSHDLNYANNIISNFFDDSDESISSVETKHTSSFLSQKDTFQDEKINLMADQSQMIEHKEETYSARREEETGSEINPELKESVVLVQSVDGILNNSVNEEHLGNTEDKISDSTEIYKNLVPHLSEHNIQDLLDLFGDHRLSWLNSQMDDSSEGHDDPGELRDFEELLEYYLKMNAKLGLSQQDESPENPALQKLFTLLSSIKRKYSSVITNTKIESKGNNKQAKEDQNNQVISERFGMNDLQNDPVFEDKTSANRDFPEDLQSGERRNEDVWTFSKNMKTSHNNDLSEEIADPQNGEFSFHKAAVFVEGTFNEISSVLDKVVSSLPDDIRPGPDLYGLPWEAVVFTGVLGLLTLLLFTCRFFHSIKSRLYASQEKQMGHKVAELLNEKCQVLETLGEVKHKYDNLESSLQNNGMSARTAEKDSLEEASVKLEQSNAQMKKQIERLEEELTQQNQERKQQEDLLAELEQVLKNLEEDSKERKSTFEQENTTLKIHEINTERLQKGLLAAKEEHAMLLESTDQLMQESEGWGERLSELEEEMKMCKRSHAGLLEDSASKEDHIKSLTECLLKMREWDPEDQSSVDGSINTAGAENGDHSDFLQKQKVQKLIEAAKMSADLKSMEEDKSRVFAKLTDEMKAKEDLQEGIKQLEEQKEGLQSESAKYSGETQKLQQKLQIMTEMYQENELKLHRMLTVEEKERSQKEERLNKAGKKISLAAEELNTYRQRAKDLEEELERTSQAYKNQIVSHEKKAHDNWLAARAADRDLADVKRENANLRQRLTDAQFRCEILEKDVREGRPVFRGERSPYGPSPLGRPSSETRAFLSPPTLMDGPPRLSPQFMGPGRASRGVVEPSSGGPELERSGPHSDSGSLSPSWDRERRGPPAPTGHPMVDPGLPFRRPPAGPYPIGPLPPRVPLPPESYFNDKSESFVRNSENESREGSHCIPGDMRFLPDPDSRMSSLPGPPMMPRPMDFRHRVPFGAPEFFGPRGPGIPPMGLRGPPPPGMFPRAPVPLPQHMGYMPPRAPSDSFPPGPPPRPSPPGSEQPPAPHDVI